MSGQFALKHLKRWVPNGINSDIKNIRLVQIKRSVEISSQDELIFSAHPEVEGGNILKQLF